MGDPLDLLFLECLLLLLDVTLLTGEPSPPLGPEANMAPVRFNAAATQSTVLCGTLLPDPLDDDEELLLLLPG